MKKIYIILLIFSLFYQITYNDNINKLHYATLSCITDLSIGGIVAILVFYNIRIVKYFENLGKFKIIVFYTIGFVYILTRVYLEIYVFFRVFERCILSLFFAFIILEQSYSKKSVYKISKNKFLCSLGKYTYSMYMFHMIFLIYIHKFWVKFEIYDNLFVDLIIKTFLIIVASLTFSILSYRYYEKPFLNFKNKFNWK